MMLDGARCDVGCTSPVAAVLAGVGAAVVAGFAGGGAGISIFGIGILLGGDVIGDLPRTTPSPHLESGDFALGAAGRDRP